MTDSRHLPLVIFVLVSERMIELTTWTRLMVKKEKGDGRNDREEGILFGLTEVQQ